MSLVPCSECGKEISSDAQFCPHCGKAMAHKSQSSVAGILSVAGIIAGAVWLYGGGFEKQVDTSMRDVQDKVAADAVDQYNIAAAQGDAMQKCVQAGMVSAAFLQAKDDGNYGVWKATEASDCAVAGIAR